MDGQFARNYAQYVEEVIKPTQGGVHRVFDEWRAEGYWAGYADEGAVVPRPVQRVRSRIKRPESLLDKFVRLSDQFPEGPTAEALRGMRDVLGTRVVVYFLSHLALVDREIRTGAHFELHPELPPRSYIAEVTIERVGLDPESFEIKGIKPSGYASIHYFLRLRDNVHSSENPWFELQTRTMVEEVWSEVEHQLGYKREQGTEFSVSRQFRVIGGHLDAIDHHFDAIYDRLTYLQSESNPQPDDKLNAENLPRVLAEYEVRVNQGELDRMLEILVSIHEVATVSELRSRARPEIVEAIKSEFQRRKSRKPTAFELVAVLVHLDSRSTVKRARQVVAGNIELVDLTNWSREPEGEPPPDPRDR